MNNTLPPCRCLLSNRAEFRFAILPVAFDTNLALDLPYALDALSIIQQRIKGVRTLIPPI